MLSRSRRVSSTATLIALAGLLGGCVTGTEVSYSEYQYDRYGGAEQIYEHNVYSDPALGIESERCRTIVRRRINAYGDEVVRRDRTCGPTGEVSTAEPWSHRASPQDGYPNHVEPPPSDVPYYDGVEVGPG